MSIASRLNGTSILCLSPALLIAARLATLQIVDRQALSNRAQHETQRISLEMSPRGRFLDRSGRVLAESLHSWSCFLDPKAAKKPEALVAKASPLLGIKSSELRQKLKSRSRFIWLKRKMDMKEVGPLESLHLEGIGIVSDQERYYPSGESAKNILGKVGAEGQGLSGLELQYNAVLSGKPVPLRWMRDGSGKGVLLHPQGPVQNPPDIRLTIDNNYQHYAEGALELGVQRFHPEKGLIMVQDPQTGDILALASYPHDPIKAFTFQDAYEPGSTYKIVAMAGLLEEKLDAPSESIDGEGGRWEISRSVFIKDHEPSGPMTLPEVLEKSSNIAAAKIGLKLGADKFYAYCKIFGFGGKTSLAYPGESAGLLKPPSQMTRVVLGNNSFGQGLAVTPLQLIGAYSAIAREGSLVAPRLVLSSGRGEAAEPMEVRKAVSAQTARRITDMLEGVVERGTGMAARVPGYYVAGKTGTAQKMDPLTQKYSPSQYIGSFIGFAPSRNPQFTILVVMDSPKNQYYGSDVAAPLFAKLMKELLALKGIPLDRPMERIQKPSVSAPPAPKKRYLGKPLSQ